MTLKRILVPFEGHASDMRALRTALNLAKGQNAHVEVWHVSPDPVELVTQSICYTPFVDRALCDTTIDTLKQVDAERRQAAEKAFDKALQCMAVTRVEGEYPADYPSASFHAAVGNAAHIISEHGRVCDLTVMSPQESGRFSEVLIGILFDTGRPLLLVPRHKGPYELNDKIMIAWNGSREAAHAVSFAMPMLERGKVWVLTAEGAALGKSSENDLIPYLRQHSVEVEPMPYDLQAATLGDTILQAAKAIDAGMIVMGAYGRSRAREMILGGVTDFMLKNADVPVLLAH